MKLKTLSFLLILTLGMSLACKKNESDSGGNFAATPTPAPAQNCADGTNPSCIPANPNYYQQNAPNFILYQWDFANGYCGCQPNYRPVFNPSWGLACSPNYWFPNYLYYSTAAVNVQNIFYGPQNGQWTSIPQVTYSPATSGNASSCGAQASLICDIRTPGSCSNGGTCRAVGGGTYMGLCTIGTGNESFSSPTPYNGCYRYTAWGWTNLCSPGQRF